MARTSTYSLPRCVFGLGLEQGRRPDDGVSDGQSVTAEEDSWSDPEKILDVEVEAVKPAGERNRKLGPRAARLPEAWRLHRARFVGELLQQQGDEAWAQGAGPLPGEPGEDGGLVGPVREREALVGHRR